MQRSADQAKAHSGLAGRDWSPWRAVIGFGVVSLLADMVYEGARSISGPLLASLGASAVLVGLITGAGEAMALVLRVVFGSWADRTGRYWTITYAGYAVTAVCVPLLAITPFLAGAGLALACFLILAERFGKAVRSPAKTALLAYAAGPVGLGRGMGVHKALDQLGAVSGPLLVAAVAAVTGALWPALAILIIPGMAALLVLAWIRRRMGDPNPAPDDHPEPSASTSVDTVSAAETSTPRSVTAFPCILAFRLRGRSRHGRSGHLRRDLVPPDHGSRGARCHDPTDLRGSDGGRGSRGTGHRKSVRPHQGSRPARAAISRRRRSGARLQHLAASRHPRCGDLGNAPWASRTPP